MQPVKTIRLIEIAAAAGVTSATVSLALNNSPKISEKTKERVRRLACELGYKPDLAARSLAQKKASGRTYLETLALLDFGHFPETLVLEQLKEYCAGTGYRLEQFNLTDNEAEQRALSRMLTMRGIRGLLICAHSAPVGSWKLEWKNFAGVAFSSSLHEKFIHNIMCCSYQDVYGSMIRIHDLGYDHPGYFYFRKVFDHWEAGLDIARRTWGRNTATPKFSCKSETEFEYKTFRKTFRQWIEKEKLDIVISHSRRLLPLFAACGLRVPEDIGYFCVDIDHADTGISGLLQQRETVSRVMLDLLHGILTRNELGPPALPFCINIPAEWNAGKTIIQKSPG
ncbi:MAG: LacI family DNA-binding transcriptional regulator [Kiritimatiellales bacterium]